MDGAMGTSLLSRGIPQGTCLEELNETRPDLISLIHQSFIDAGAQILVTNTFGANRTRLGPKAEGLERFNREGVKIAKKIAGGRKVFASIGPLGVHVGAIRESPLQIFKDQAFVLEKETPDGYLVETMTSLAEAEAIARMVREVSDRLLIVSLTFPRGVEKFVGAHRDAPLHEEISKTLREAGADVLGFNCGTHPREAFEFLSALKEVDPGPWLARPSAGTPGNIVSPQEFAAWGVRLAELGVTYLGGCCGTTPGHIRAMKMELAL